jgi:hypothetical protein
MKDVVLEAVFSSLFGVAFLDKIVISRLHA